MSIPKPIKKLKPFTRNWERLANIQARGFVTIRPCRHCGRPVIHTYCCTFNKCPDPYNP